MCLWLSLCLSYLEFVELSDEFSISVLEIFSHMPSNTSPGTPITCMLNVLVMFHISPIICSLHSFSACSSDWTVSINIYSSFLVFTYVFKSTIDVSKVKFSLQLLYFSIPEFLGFLIISNSLLMFSIWCIIISSFFNYNFL